jgi:hypothetical protein
VGVGLAQPAVAAGSTTGVVTSQAITLGSPSTPGNCLAVCVAVISSVTAGTVSAVTIGGVADNFGSLVTLNGSSGQGAVWACPGCGQSSATVVVSITGGSGGQGIAAAVFEFSGLAPAAVLDRSSTHNTTVPATAWTSNATAATSNPSEAWVGMGFGKAAGLISISGPVSPWSNVTSQTVRPGGSGNPALFTAGYQIVSATGTATYAGTFSTAASGAGLVAALLPSLARPLPVRAQPNQAVRRASSR